MSIEYNKQEYGSSKGILVFPDHYVAYAQIFAKDHALAVTTSEGRKIVKAGTIFPANDATAVGVVLNDVDVTYGDVNAAVVIHGFVKTAALPAVPSANAKSALKGIQFLPISANVGTFSATKATIAAAAATGTTATATIYVDGDTFRAEAATLTNWTIAGEATTKVSVESITVAADGKSAVVALKTTATAVAGDVTLIPDAEVMGLGVTTTTAVVIATVA